MGVGPIRLELGNEKDGSWSITVFYDIKGRFRSLRDALAARWLMRDVLVEMGERVELTEVHFDWVLPLGRKVRLAAKYLWETRGRGLSGVRFS